MRPRVLEEKRLSNAVEPASDQFIGRCVFWFALLYLGLILGAIAGCSIPLPPVPKPEPPPVVVPVSDGHRFALILQESQQQTPEMARMIVELHAGESSAYFAKHNHSVVVLDIDAKDENGQPLDVIQRLKPSIANKPLPVLIVADKTNEGRVGNVLSCESIKAAPLAADVVAAVKKSGGGE